MRSLIIKSSGRRQTAGRLIGLVLLLSVSVFGSRQAARAQDQAASRRAAYDKFVAPFVAGKPESKAPDPANRLRLILTTFYGDEEAPKRQPGALLFNTLSTSQTVVYANGKIRHLHHSPMGMSGSSGTPLSAIELKRLDQLLTRLPDDNFQVPPPGRRLVVQVPAVERKGVHVYDLANLPDRMLEICRLIHSIGSWSPLFQPVSQWQVADRSPCGLGVATLTPDRQLIVISEWSRPLEFWNFDTHQRVKQLPHPVDIATTRLVYSPDGKRAATEGWGFVGLIDTTTWHKVRLLEEESIRHSQDEFSFPVFTPDGQFLLIRGRQHGLRVFDATTGEPRAMLPGLPDNALSYVPLAGTNRALYNARDDALVLRDTRRRRDLATLDTNSSLEQCALSPDQSLVATATARPDRYGFLSGYRIRVWKVSNGNLVRELRLFELDTGQAVTGFLWSPDGRYLLATLDTGIWAAGDIAVWSLKSGRQRGWFGGEKRNSMDHVSGLMWLPDGRLIARCCDGYIRVWQATEAFRAMDAFEQSFSKH